MGGGNNRLAVAFCVYIGDHFGVDSSGSDNWPSGLLTIIDFWVLTCLRSSSLHWSRRYIDILQGEIHSILYMDWQVHRYDFLSSSSLSSPSTLFRTLFELLRSGTCMCAMGPYVLYCRFMLPVIGPLNPAAVQNSFLCGV